LGIDIKDPLPREFHPKPAAQLDFRKKRGRVLKRGETSNWQTKKTCLGYRVLLRRPLAPNPNSRIGGET